MNTLILSGLALNLLATVGLGLYVSVRLGVLEGLARDYLRTYHHVVHGSLREEEYSLWSSRNGKWDMVRPCTAPGLDVGPPPSREGRFEGEIVRTPGVEGQVGVRS